MQDTSRLAYKQIQSEGIAASQKEIIYNLCLDQEKLEKTKVHEFMELFVK